MRLAEYAGTKRQRNHLDFQCCENMIIRAESPDAPLLTKPSRTLSVYPSYLEIMLIHAHLHQPSPFMNAYYSDLFDLGNKKTTTTKKLALLFKFVNLIAVIGVFNVIM